jgi:hypothetical protein
MQLSARTACKEKHLDLQDLQYLTSRDDAEPHAAIACSYATMTAMLQAITTSFADVCLSYFVVRESIFYYLRYSLSSM